MTRGLPRGLRRVGLLLALAAIGTLALVACKQRKPPSPDPPDSSPKPAAATDAKLTELSARLVTRLSESKFESVHGHFDKTMSKAMSKDKLADLWIGLEAKLGEYVGQLGTDQSEHDGYQIVHVTTQFEHLVMDLRFVFDKERKIAGFFVKPPKNPDVYGPRPQHPKPPYPYVEREVSFDNPEDGAKFAGTLTLPKGDGPFPAAILITGSGSQDRDETVFGHKPFLVIADHLTRNGIAVLRVDDRGSGKTKGDTTKATIELHATDVAAAIAFLHEQKEIDNKRIGLIGHSEGGIIAPLVAAKAPDYVAFIVSLAGTGLPGTEINPLQIEALLRADGSIKEPGIQAIVAEQRKLMKLVAEDADAKTIDAALRQTVKVALEHAPADKKKYSAKYLQAQVAAQAPILSSAWFKSFLKLNPAVHWAKVQCPVLALNGAKDLQVPAKQNLAAIAKAMKGNDKLTTTELPELNHMFQKATTGLVSEYAKIQQTFDPDALSLIGKWVVEQTKK